MKHGYYIAEKPCPVCEGAEISEILQPKNVEKLELGPNDILVVMSDQCISQSNAERIGRYFEELIPGQKVIVLDNALKLGVIRKTL